MIEPKMTLKQVIAWQKRRMSIPDIGAVSKTIARISGITMGAAKSNL
jgi:hypothetical protein